MSIRSLLLGFLAVVALCLFSYFNDNVLRSGRMISSLMPVVCYGALLFFLLTIQPLLRRYGEKAFLNRKEVATALALFLLAAGIPGLGLVSYLPTALMMPHHEQRVRPGWEAENVVGIAPKQMLAEVDGEDSKVLDGYVTGLATGDQHISLSEVPWHAWKKALMFWIPLILCALFALFGLATVLHTQWVKHEQLPYPITIFTKSLLPAKDGVPAVFRSRLFWMGFGMIFAIELNNYLLRFFPDILIPVRLSFDFSAMQKLAPVLLRGAGNALFHPRIWIPTMALAYFLPSELSFSMAFFPFVYCLIFGVCVGYGIPFRCGRMLGPSIEQSIYAGGYSAILLMLLYTGRHFFWNTFRQSFRFRSGQLRDTTDHAVWGMRIFLVCTLLFIIQLVSVGLDWQLAIVYTFFVFMVHTVISRMIAETGGFIIGTYVYPGVIIWAFCGSLALGPRTMLIMFLVSTVLVSGPGWAPMPFFVQALNLGEVAGLRIKRLAKWGLVVIVVAIAISVPSIIYWQYDQGAPTRGWPRSTSWYPFENMVEVKQTLRGQGQLHIAEQVEGFSRFAHIRPRWMEVGAFGITLALALLIGFGRLRFPWWPFHPMVFVFLGGFPAYMHWFSFLLGWLIKHCASKYGGAATYQRVKPLMLGMIAGYLLAKFVPQVVEPILYWTRSG